MKKLLILYITLLPLIGYSDTLDYWSVYINDSLIGQYNSLSTENELVIKSDSIDQNDVISIRYGNDHPCAKCEYYYAVKEIKNGVKIHVERRNEILKEVSFPLIKLSSYKESKEFEFFLYEDNYISTNKNYIPLFRLKIE